MTLASYKDLCIDAADAAALGGFWARVLDLRLVDLGGNARLDPPEGRPSSEVIWVNRVPEPRTGGTRVHLDLRLPAADPAPLVAAGATLRRSPDEEINWWVLADPEGNEFRAACQRNRDPSCAFPPRDGTTAGIHELVVAATDPLAQARWWSTVVGGEVGQHAGGAYLAGAAGFPWQYWVFDRVPGPKQVKNRLHWDVLLAGPDPEPLVAAGARILRPKGGDISWWILADPEGNDFCGFPS